MRKQRMQYFGVAERQALDVLVGLVSAWHHNFRRCSLLIAGPRQLLMQAWANEGINDATPKPRLHSDRGLKTLHLQASHKLQGRLGQI